LIPRRFQLCLTLVVSAVVAGSCGRTQLNSAGGDPARDGSHDVAGDGPQDGIRDIPWWHRDATRRDAPRNDGPRVDLFVWPDTTPKDDLWPKTDTYSSGTPFGCSSDADCFHIKCCPTPWGVKLCMGRCP